ncbi:hypothetical protein [uncultured Fibrobacter sp.]|jgi:hypothetical protein|uniref:hypothetical protein n=1 Tax=uncultured Fibrobacter sp. TaxID=261512 RepID=UPI0025E1AF9F|nr:hypothetical protein [uncultured Fibrobacter sp.]
MYAECRGLHENSAFLHNRKKRGGYRVNAGKKEKWGKLPQKRGFWGRGVIFVMPSMDKTSTKDVPECKNFYLAIGIL